jgi:hypothetical protein
VREVIVAVLADHDSVVALRAKGMSWSQVAAQFSGSRTVNLTPGQADAWHKNGFAVWVERRSRMLITARLEGFARLRDLSALAGEHVSAKRKEEWVGPFLRGQFLKLERRQEGRCQKSS